MSFLRTRLGELWFQPAASSEKRTAWKAARNKCVFMCLCVCMWDELAHTLLSSPLMHCIVESMFYCGCSINVDTWRKTLLLPLMDLFTSIKSIPFSLLLGRQVENCGDPVLIMWVFIYFLFILLLSILYVSGHILNHWLPVCLCYSSCH